MVKISAIILTKNVENLIADCIDSVSFCDEIILIDDGSTDRTVDIAKHLGANVFSLISRSFAVRRNYGLKKAKGKWILYIDADERITDTLRANIQGLLNEKKNAASVYLLQRKNFYLGNHEWPYIEKLERLFKKTSLEEWYGDLHESPKVQGDQDVLQGFLLHYTHRNLTSMLDKTIEWSLTEAQLRLKTQHPKITWWRFFRVFFTGFYQSYITQKGYSVGTVGLIESTYQGYSLFITYARLWELQNQKISSEFSTSM